MSPLVVFYLCYLLCLVLGSACVATVCLWSSRWRGGFAWNGSALQFNWHPVLMVVGLVVVYGYGEQNLSFVSGPPVEITRRQVTSDDVITTAKARLSRSSVRDRLSMTTRKELCTSKNFIDCRKIFTQYSETNLYNAGRAKMLMLKSGRKNPKSKSLLKVH